MLTIELLKENLQGNNSLIYKMKIRTAAHRVTEGEAANERKSRKDIYLKTCANIGYYGQRGISTGI